MKIHVRLSAFIWFAFVFPLISHAQGNKLTLINHYSHPLTVIVGINPNTVPDFPQPLSIAPNAQVSSQVVVQGPEAYIRAEDGNGHYGFFGVEYKDQLKIYGYMSKGLAFSWKNGTITFCSPEEYRQHKTC